MSLSAVPQLVISTQGEISWDIKDFATLKNDNRELHITKDKTIGVGSISNRMSPEGCCHPAKDTAVREDEEKVQDQ